MHAPRIAELHPSKRAERGPRHEDPVIRLTGWSGGGRGPFPVRPLKASSTHSASDKDWAERCAGRPSYGRPADCGRRRRRAPPGLWSSLQRRVRRVAGRFPVRRSRPAHSRLDDLWRRVFWLLGGMAAAGLFGGAIFQINKMSANVRLQRWPGFGPVHRGGPKGMGASEMACRGHRFS